MWDEPICRKARQCWCFGFNSIHNEQRPQRENSPYICDFSRGVLNTHFCARIQHLLRGHRYRGYSLFAGCLLAGAGEIKSQWWGIWGVEIRFSAYTYIVFSGDVYQTIQHILIVLHFTFIRLP